MTTQAEITSIQHDLAAATALAGEMPSSAAATKLKADLATATAQAALLAPTPPAPVPTVPGAPTGLSAAVSGTTVTTSWTNASGVLTGSVIMLDGAPSGSVIGSISTFPIKNVTPGTHTITVANTNAVGTGPTASTTATVSTPTGVALASIANQSGIQNTPITVLNLTATGGVVPITWAATGLPNGLTIKSTANNTASISGTPTAAGTFSVTVTATDSTTPTHGTASRTFTFTIAAPASLAITRPTGFPTTSPTDIQTVSPDGAPTTWTQPHAYAQVGDLVYAYVWTFSPNVPLAGISGTQSIPSGSPGGWALVPGSRNEDANVDVCVEIWQSTASDTSSADVLTLTYSADASTSGGGIWAGSLEGVGVTSVWTIAGENIGGSDSPVTSILSPEILAPATSLPMAYLAIAVFGDHGTGTTSGSFVVTNSSVSGNSIVENIAVTTSQDCKPALACASGFAVAASILVELSSGNVPSSVLTLAPISNKTGTVGTPLSVGMTVTGGVLPRTVTAAPLPAGEKISGTTISGTPTTPGNTTVTVTVTDSATPTPAVVTQTFTIAVAAVVTPPAGTLVPNVPAGTVVPTNLIMGPGVAGALGSAGEFATKGSLDRSIWQPFWGNDGSDNAVGPADEPTVTNSANVTFGPEGVILTMQTDNSSGLIDSNPAWVSPGFQFQPTASKPVFTEWLASLPVSGGQFGANGTLWQTGQSWPATGEIDIVESGGPSLDYCVIDSGGNVPPCPVFFPIIAAYEGFCTYGCLWEVGQATFFYNGKKMGNAIPLPYALGPFYLVASVMLPISAGSAPQSQVIEYVRVWQ